MNILLIEPPSGLDLLDHFFVHEPLGLEYLGAGLLADGHRVEILDARFDPDVEAACRRLRPDVVGLTGYTVQLRFVKAFAAAVKKLAPAIRVVVGGHHATVRPADFDQPFIDAIVVGEGVGPLRELLTGWEHGRERPAVPGVAYPGPDLSTFTPRPHPELDSLPFPARNLTARYRNRYFAQWLKPLATVRTSLGCVSRCSFCALWSLTGGRYLRRDPEAILAELREVAEPNILFCDDEAMCDVRRMERLAELIREAGIRKRYFLQARVDTIAGHPRTFALWREIGLDQVFVGMESFSEERLRALKKGITAEQQVRALEILDELGIHAYGSFIVDPSAGRRELREYGRRVAGLRLGYATFSILTPFPGTELYAEQESRLTSRNPNLFDLAHAVLPTTLPLDEFYAEYARLFRKANPLHRRLGMLRKYGFPGVLSALHQMGISIGRLRKGYLDHRPGDAAVSG
jgi:hopanoid C-3 methylase